MRISPTFYFIPILLLCSCSSEKSSEKVLPDSTFVKFFADSLIISDEIKIGRMDSSQLRIKIDSLYNKYRFTRDETAITLGYHQENIERWKTFYEKVIKQMELIQQIESR